MLQFFCARLLRFFLLLTILIPALSNAQIEVRGGGVLLAKPYAWSPRNEITNAYEFEVLVNHTGYVSLNPGASERQVQTAIVVEVLSDVGANLTNIASESDLKPLVESLAHLEELTSRYACTRTALAGRVAFLKAEITRFRQNNLKIDGKWVASAEIQRQRVQALAAQQQAILGSRANELVQAFHRKENTSEQCDQIVQELRANHSGDPVAQRVIASWQKDKSLAVAFQAELKPFLQAAAKDGMVQAVNAATDLGQLPSPSAELHRQAIAFAQRWLELQEKVHPATNYTLRTELDAFWNTLQLCSALKKIRLADVPSASEELSKKSPLGADSVTAPEYQPLTNAVDHTRALIKRAADTFHQHCTQAKAFEKQGKTTQAIEEYRKAAAISRDPEVLKKIQELRENSLGRVHN